MAKISCIDVSTWNPSNIDWKKVKAAGITSVIIRAGFGRETSQKDNKFETHYKKAKAAGLNIGVYWYSYAVSVADAQKEAKACLACIKGKPLQLPVYFDMEENSQTKYGKSTLTAMAKAFCEAIKKGGYRAGVYANLNWFTHYLDYASLKKSYSIWLAQYNSSNQLACDIWQNSSTGKILGIAGNVDTNVIYNTKIIVSSKPAKTPPVLDSTGFKKGNKTKGVLALKELLLIAKKKGIISQGVDENMSFGDGTKKAVNQVLKIGGYKQNGIAGEKFIKYLTKLIFKKI